MDTATQQQGQPQAPAPKAAKKPRTRRSIEDELAALNTRKAALLEKQRRAQAREKIILGALAAAFYRGSNPQGRQLMRQWFISHAAEKDRETVRGVFVRLESDTKK